jgi:hypothetical protein
MRLTEQLEDERLTADEVESRKPLTAAVRME